MKKSLIILSGIMALAITTLVLFSYLQPPINLELSLSPIETLNETGFAELTLTVESRNDMQGASGEITLPEGFELVEGSLEWETDLEKNKPETFKVIVKSIKSGFAENVKLYEEERKKYADYYKQRKENIKNSYVNESEPPFNSKICAETAPIDSNTKWNFCSCGDGVCASYEDMCNCEKDCGSCPDGTICRRGECVEIINDVCMNNICEEGENETCPWDCKVYMVEEEEEIIGENKTEEYANNITNAEDVS